MVLDFVYPSPGCGKDDNRPSIVKDIHFTYFSAILLVLAALVILLVSLITKRPDKRKVSVILQNFLKTTKTMRSISRHVVSPIVRH